MKFRDALKKAAIELDDSSFSSLVKSLTSEGGPSVDWRKFLRRYHDLRLHGPCPVIHVMENASNEQSLNVFGSEKCENILDTTIREPSSYLAPVNFKILPYTYTAGGTKASFKGPPLEVGATGAFTRDIIVPNNIVKQEIRRNNTCSRPTFLTSTEDHDKFQE